ncbi:MAG TPA: cation-translocating P-type ATPase, partial [Chitinophagales bacterium]|nr:cation-translocating P-type ATPase [Chitinophagales bacterium]
MRLPFHDKKFLFLLGSIAIVLTLEVLSILGIHIPMPYAPFVFGAFIIGVGYPVIINGFKALFKLNFSSINLLMVIAAIGAFYLGEYPEAAVVIVLYVLGERLEDIGIENSKSAMDELISKSPKTAVLKSTGAEVMIDKVPVGSIIQVKPGDMIPLDGKITSGETTVDEATITGEPIPKDKEVGDSVFAGTLNKNGFIEVETTKLSADTTFSKIVKLTFEASANKSKTHNFIQKFSKYYTPTIILLSLMVFIIPVFVLHLPLEKWLNQAITLLVIACPCALVISTPVAIYAAIGNASSKGVLVKGGKYLEAFAGIKAIALDKTRTITYGKPVVSDVIPLNGTSKEELLACSSGAEVFSEHPLADAIIAECKREGLEPHAVEKFKSIMGKGAIAKCLVCEDETIYVGKLSFIKEHQPVDDIAEKKVEQLSAEGKTSVVVSFGKGAAGIIALTDEIKPDSADALKQLIALGIEPIMLTGDAEKAAHYVANKIGITKVYGGLLPEDKAAKMKELIQQYSSVAMVGDGVNDSPALAQSTVGIAMGAAGSDSAIEVANIALMNDRLSLLPYLVRLGRATVRT